MERHHTYLTSFDEVVIPALMLDAPFSRTMTGARRMIELREQDAAVVDASPLFFPGRYAVLSCVAEISYKILL
jgi:hypothetical protein